VPSLATLDPLALLRPPRWPWRSWPGLEGARVELHYLARAGVFRAVRHLLGRRPGAVLMPAYHHGVEVEAVRAGGGAVSFYRVDEEMRVDLEDLRRRARREGARLIYLTHYAGFAQPVNDVASLAAELGVPFFEDCALSLFARDPSGKPLGTTGAAACFCLYKTLPVPHGGLLRAPDGLAGARKPPAGPSAPPWRNGGACDPHGRGPS
jgi:selenocysteine lyase/cysteine desulfurase